MIRRQTLLSLVLVAFTTGACSQETKKLAGSSSADPSEHFRGLGMELVVDVMADERLPGGEVLGVEFFVDGSDRRFYTKSAQKYQDVMLLSQRVPQRVRVVWHDRDEIIRRPDGNRTYAGNILGDYVIPVGERIPPEVTESVRKDGGQLRIKFRLAKDAVYFGWDIARRASTNSPPQYFHTGGDFQEARLIYGADGRPSRGKGWYMDKKTGQRVETDF